MKCPEHFSFFNVFEYREFVIVEMKGGAFEVVPAQWIFPMEPAPFSHVRFPDTNKIDTYTVQAMVERSAPVDYHYFFTKECKIVRTLGESLKRIGLNLHELICLIMMTADVNYEPCISFEDNYSKACDLRHRIVSAKASKLQFDACPGVSTAPWSFDTEPLKFVAFF